MWNNGNREGLNNIEENANEIEHVVIMICACTLYNCTVFLSFTIWFVKVENLRCPLPLVEITEWGCPRVLGVGLRLERQPMQGLVTTSCLQSIHSPNQMCVGNRLLQEENIQRGRVLPGIRPTESCAMQSATYSALVFDQKKIVQREG